MLTLIRNKKMNPRRTIQKGGNVYWKRKKESARQQPVMKILASLFAAVLIFVAVGSAGAATDVYVDNGDVDTSFTGTWPVSVGANPYGVDSQWSRDGSTYTWEFNPDTPGVYEVSLWYSEWSSRATNVPVTIFHAQGETDTTINQQENPGTWVSVGKYFFDTVGSVRVTAAYGSTVSTCADAAWFRFDSDNTPPTAFIDSIDPSPAEPADLITFAGSGTDNEGGIAAYEWTSNIDGLIGTTSSFSRTLSEGAHIITLKVMDDGGLWSAEVSQDLIVGEIPTEIIIDNLDTDSTSLSGTWVVSSATGFYGSDSLWSRDGNTFTFHFTPPQEGDYEVSLWWTEWASRSDSVPVTISHAGGSDVVTVNQQSSGAQWNALGTFTFNASGGSVMLTAQPYPASTCADAVKFNFVPSNDKPVASIVSIDPNPAANGEIVYFDGYAEDTDGTISIYEWTSDKDGSLSDQEDFDTTTLSENVHVISFRVQDNEGQWSDTVTESLTVGNPPNAIPVAFIDSISPNPVNPGDTVSFVGHGTDADGYVDSYWWESDLDGFLSNSAEFETSSLSLGTHVIRFEVFDDDGAASPPVEATLAVEEIPVDVIIDNNDSNTSRVGTWGVSSASGSHDEDSLWSRDGTSFTWEFTPPVSSYYEVLMWWTLWSSRGTGIPVTISHGGGTSTVYVDQQTGGGQWNSLDQLYFNADTPYNITITSLPAPASTCADAVRLVRIEDPTTKPPVARFTSDRTYGGEPVTIQFYDQSSSSATEWLWDFGDNTTSAQQNPAHEYTQPGNYTVSLTASNAYGSDTETKEYYISVYAAVENIYLCDGYSSTDVFRPRCYNYLEGIGATDHGSYWRYENPVKGVIYYIYYVHDPQAMEAALKEEGAHIIFNGHSNYGLGASFGSYMELSRQQIDDIYFVDDDRFVNYSTEMMSVSANGMRFGQAYPNWKPIFKDGTSALMPYDFDEGLPAYNYYLTYTLPGDPETYRVEMFDGSYLQRFPYSGRPAWFSADGSPPDPDLNPQYFITNPGEVSLCSFEGDWPYGEDEFSMDYNGYNYQYHQPGSGSNTAVYTMVVNHEGFYDVLASWWADPGNATNTGYSITHAGGTDTVYVNQQETEEDMNLLGTYFFNEGTYTVEVNDVANGRVVVDSVRFDSANMPDVLLKAEFEADVYTGSAPLTVEFDDDSLGYGSVINSRTWDFGDLNTSTATNPTHTYTSPGVYTVSLTVTNEVGDSDTETKQALIVVDDTPALTAEFTANRLLASSPRTVYFKDQSKGNITSWEWDFGDGGSSTSQYPSHQYTEPGSYTVMLTVYDDVGSATHTEVGLVTIVAQLFVDNHDNYKPHYGSKIVLNTSDIRISTEDMRYSRLFYGGCNSSNYYVGSFNRGIFFYSTASTEHVVGPEYLRRYLLGDTDDEIIAVLNSIEDLYEYYDFTKKPPSMR